MDGVSGTSLVSRRYRASLSVRPSEIRRALPACLGPMIGVLLVSTFGTPKQRQPQDRTEGRSIVIPYSKRVFLLFPRFLFRALAAAPSHNSYKDAPQFSLKGQLPYCSLLVNWFRVVQVLALLCPFLSPSHFLFPLILLFVLTVAASPPALAQQLRALNQLA
jgi:hypothetical protein